MDRLGQFRADIEALEQLPEGLELLYIEKNDEIRAILDPLLADGLDEADFKAFQDAIWEQFGCTLIEQEKKKVSLLNRLAGLYEQLGSADDEEWESYMTIVNAARLKTLQRFLRMFQEAKPLDLPSQNH